MDGLTPGLVVSRVARHERRDPAIPCVIATRRRGSRHAAAVRARCGADPTRAGRVGEVEARMRGCGRTGRHLHITPRPRTRLCAFDSLSVPPACGRRCAAVGGSGGPACLVPVPQRDGEATTGRYHDEPPARSKNEQASQPSDVHTNTSRYTGRYSMSAPTPSPDVPLDCAQITRHVALARHVALTRLSRAPSVLVAHGRRHRQKPPTISAAAAACCPPLWGRQIGILLPSSEAPHSHAPRAHYGACASAPDEPRLTTPRLTTPRMMPPCLTTSLRPHLTWPWPCLCLWQRPPRRRPFWRPPASRPRPRRPPRRPLRRRRPRPPPLHPRRHRR